MISKQDILDRAAEWRLRADVVEKDYVLGWLLAGLGAHPVVRDFWAFKGGTCIKKCYFETYRFSEDLDFSFQPSAPYSAEEIRRVLLEMTASVAEMSGIVFPGQFLEVRERRNKQGQLTFQGKIAYGGPLRQINNPTPPRVLLDLTRHEPILDAPNPRTIFHPYPDSLPEGASIMAYSVDELLAEKTRALYERTRPRDLYDVVCLLDNPPRLLRLEQVCTLFGQKCGVKGLAQPTASALCDMARRDEELRSEWSNMLAHQLPELPELDSVLARLPELLAWIERPATPLPMSRLTAVAVGRDEVRLDAPSMQYWGGEGPLETIRFAGANRLLVEFNYHGWRRSVEPYSLRRAGTGNLLLYGWELASQQIKAFKVREMSGLQSTRTSFVPRHQIELTAVGEPMVRVASSTGLPRSYPTSLGKARTRTRQQYGPVYVFACPFCRKEFRHSKNDSKLRKHKQPGGAWDCPGQRGYLVRID